MDENCTKIGTDGGRFFEMRHDILHDRLQGEDFSNLTLPESRLLSTPRNLNPKENLWDEIREKIFKNYALKSIDAVRAKLKQVILYIERNPETVKSAHSPTSSSHSDVKMVLDRFR